MLSPKVIQLLADAKIDAAIENGDFDRLNGFGKPFEFDTMYVDPNWWIRRKIELEQIEQLQKPDRNH